MKRHSTYNTYLTKINNIFNTDLLHSIAILLLLFILLTYTNTIHQTHSQTDISNFTPIGQANCLARGSGFQAVFAGYSRPTTTASTTYYTISGLNINNPGANSQGLFSCASNATITDVIIKNSRIQGNSSVGSLLGFAGANVNIFNSGVSNSEVNGVDNSVGGLVGQVAPGTTTAIFNLTNSYSLATTTGGSGVGGLIGVATGSANYVNIQNSYMAGLVKSTAQAQGVPTPSLLGSTGVYPGSMTIDTQGNIYTGNWGSDSVTRITPTGSTTNWQLPTNSNPWGITIDSIGNIYTANYTSNKVSRITPAGVVNSNFASTGPNPRGITVDYMGNIYVANSGSNTVTKITPAGVTSLITVGNSPKGVIPDPQGNIYTANWSSNNVTKITTLGSTSILATTGNNPVAITIDPQGNIYTANENSGTVTRITPAGATSTIAVGARPMGVVSDSSGNIYVANYNSNSVSKISPAGLVTNTFSIVGSGTNPAGIVVDSSGNIYTSNNSSANVTKITGSQPTATLGGLIGENGILKTGNDGFLNLVNNLVLGKINPVTVNGLVSSATGFLIGKNQAALAGLGYRDTNIVSYSNYCNDRLDNGYNTASLSSPNGMQLIGGANPLRFSAYNTEANKSLSPTTNAIATGQQGARALTTSPATRPFNNIVTWSGVVLYYKDIQISGIYSRGTPLTGPKEFQFFTNGNERNIPAIYRNTKSNVPTDLVAGQFINNIAATTSDIRNYINYIPTCPLITNSKAVI